MKDLKKLLSNNEHLLSKYLDADIQDILFSTKQVDKHRIQYAYELVSHALSDIYSLINKNAFKPAVIDVLSSIKTQAVDKYYNVLYVFCTKNYAYTFSLPKSEMPHFIINGYTIYFIESNICSIVVTKNNCIIAIGDIIDNSIRWTNQIVFSLKYYFTLDTPNMNKSFTDAIVSNIILRNMHWYKRYNSYTNIIKNDIIRNNTSYTSYSICINDFIK